MFNIFNKFSSEKFQKLNYYFIEKALIIFDKNKKKTLNFDFPIKQVEQFKNNILIRLEPDIGKILNENIYCFSLDGKFLWQIKPRNYISKDSPYTNMMIKNDKIFLYSWDGERIQVNPNNGYIISEIFTK